MFIRFIIAMVFIVNTVFSVFCQTELPFGVYVTKEDYLNKKVTPIRKLQASENFNVGVLNYKALSIDSTELDAHINCIKENYFGIHYIDGDDYMLLDGFYAKIVLLGRIDFLISPKADFTLEKDGKYTFIKNEGKINYYFIKNLDPNTETSFEKQIADEKLLVKDYQKDKDNYGEFINKQIAYLKKYNAIVPKVKPEKKK